MLILYDTAHNKLCGLNSYADLYVEQAIGSGSTPIILDQLHFKYAIEDGHRALIDYECYIGTEDAEYIVKEINYQTADGSTAGPTWVEYICDLNVESLKGSLIDSFAPGSVLAEDAANLALVGTGWVVGYSDLTKRRTAAAAHCTAFEALADIAKAYACEITFDTIRKQVILHQRQGADRGAYFAEQLNLKTLQVQGNSRDYVTRLYPIGKDGLTITGVNGGQAYVSNHQYSVKVIAAYWIDNRYTVAADLLADATERLDYLSKPTRAYGASIVDLARVSDKWGLLDFALGDFITLLAESTGVREQQRIVKIDRYPEEPEKSTVEIANRLASLDDIILRVSDAADTVSDATDSTGAIQGGSVQVSNGDGTFSTLNAAVANIGTLIAAKATITDLQAANARIDNLTSTKVDTTYLTAHYIDADSIVATYATISNVQATYATIDSLIAATGRIGTLEANSATITQLTAATGRIGKLESHDATIVNLLSNSAGIGSLTSDSVAAAYAALVTASLGDAQIAHLSVSKLLAGIISTDKFTVASDAGNLSISGNTLHVWDETGKERVTLGLNAGDYNLTVRASDGQTTIFGAAGVTHAGITDGAVDDSKVAANASINGSKIDQESLITRINGASTLLQSSRINYDPTGQTLNVVFNSLSNTVTAQQQTLSDHGTSISTMQGQITNKVWETDVLAATAQVGTNLFAPAVGSLTGVGSAAATQIIINGNISNGTSGWTGYNAALSAGNRIITAIGGAAQPALACRSTNYLSSIFVGHRYYIRARVRVSSVKNIVYFKVGMQQAGNPWTIDSISIPFDTEWHTVSAIVTTTHADTFNFTAEAYFSSAADANGVQLQLDGSYGMMSVDMGADNGNPFYGMTSDQMAKMVQKKGYWEGSSQLGGLDITVISDGTVSLDGVAPNAFAAMLSPALQSPYSYRTSTVMTMISGQKYTGSITILSGNMYSGTVSFGAYDTSGQSYPSGYFGELANPAAVRTITAGTPQSAGLSQSLNVGNFEIYVPAGSNFSNYTFRLKFELGAAATPWCQALGGLQSQISIHTSEISQNAANISMKVNANGVISAINQSAESIQIQAGKIDLSGYVTITGLSGGTTSIDGSCIKTGRISADRIDTTNLNAQRINSISGYYAAIGKGPLQNDQYGLCLYGSDGLVHGEMMLRNQDTVTNGAVGILGEYDLYLGVSNYNTCIQIDAGTNGNDGIISLLAATTNASAFHANSITVAGTINGHGSSSTWPVPTTNITSFVYAGTASYAPSGFCTIDTTDGTHLGITCFASDRSLKCDIEDSAVNALSDLRMIQHRQFYWRNGCGHQDLGWVAQELEEINPLWVLPLPQPDGRIIEQINEQMILPYITRSIQQIADADDYRDLRIAALESQLAATRAELAEIRAKVA